MESQPQNPEFRNNPENLHPCIALITFFLNIFKSESGNLYINYHQLTMF